MDLKTVKSAIRYWLDTAEHDYETMLILFRTKRYSDSLFYGHIALEKLLKAHVVLHTKEQAPYIHDLLRLNELSNVCLSEEEIDLLDEVNNFNIRARYPEYKLEFYKKCTKLYTEPYIKRIQNLYRILCRELKQKK
ncbi:HEPN domain-containing protein [Candidatus Uhrbacteria bacterium]|nr:HEPN domain-containing protein [Candidatus Uhrbacteria bacterium]